MPRSKPVIKAEDLYRLELPRSPRISPDGKFVVYAVTRVDKKTEKRYSNLWLAPTKGGRPAQFTYGDQNDSTPRWSPDGSQIAFLSNRGNPEKPPQIYLIALNGGEARPLTNLKGAISSFSWSPDGKKLLCGVRKTDPEVLEREKDEQKKKLGVVSRHYERVFFKADGGGYLGKERSHIWLVDARSGRGTQLTDHEVYDEGGPPAWSPDGERIAFISNRSSDPDFNISEDDLFIIPANGKPVNQEGFRKIKTPAGNKFYPSFSPDGKWIAYIGKEGKGDWWKNDGLWIVPADGSAAPKNLTAPYDLHVSAGTLNDIGGQEMVPPTWTNDSQRIFFQADRHGSTEVRSISISVEDMQTHVGPGGAAGEFSLDNSQNTLAYFQAKMTDPGQIYTLDLARGRVRQLTRLNPWLKRLDLGHVEQVWIKGPDGNDLQGWILQPPGFDPAKKHPSILEIHGGPLLQYGHFFMHEFFLLAARGYVVHFCNPRGGQGYGEAHSKAIWGAWGTVDYDDLMAWAETVQKLPYIDPQRMGVAGGSYGGYMTLWIIGHTQRFKAAVAMRVVSNFTSMWGSSDGNWVFQQVIGDKPPYRDVMNAWDRSPMKHIGNAATPTLIIHSENDFRTPIEQGEQAFVALKQLGVDTEMVRFPGEPHGLSRQGRTDRRVVRLNHILRWFDRYLKGK